MGTMHSRPMSSASCASLRLLSQLASQRSGSVKYERPLEQLEPKRPSFNPLPPCSPGLRLLGDPTNDLQGQECADDPVGRIDDLADFEVYGDAAQAVRVFAREAV